MCDSLALVDNVIAMINSESALLGFLQNHPKCIRDEFESDAERMTYEYVKLKHDEDFCRVREILRDLKGDKNLLAC